MTAAGRVLLTAGLCAALGVACSVAMVAAGMVALREWCCGNGCGEA